MNDELTTSMRLACETMGVQLHNSDRFCKDSIEWLTRRGKISIFRSQESWNVIGIGFASPDESLASALCGAVHAAALIDELSEWEAASDEIHYE